MKEKSQKIVHVSKFALHACVWWKNSFEVRFKRKIQSWLISVHAHFEKMSLHLELQRVKGGKKKTLKEQYVGFRPIAGFPGCFNRTEGYPECLPPGELVRTAINTQKLWGIPENTALSRDQFVSLMRNIENYDRNDYICLMHSLPESQPEFNPYRFKCANLSANYYLNFSETAQFIF